MNIVETKTPQQYNDEQKKLLKIFRFKKENIEIKGSSIIANVHNFADYDFYTDIKREYGSEEVYDEFHKILKLILDNKDMYFVEFKMQNKKGKKKRFYYGDNFSFKNFNEHYNDNLEYCKIDIVLFSMNRFIDCSCIYNFHGNKIEPEEYIKLINSDIKDLKKENNFFKILKKIYLLSKAKNDYNKLEYLTEIFNSNLGLDYKNINNIDAIDTVKKYYNDPFTKQKIEHNLNEIGYPQKYQEEYKKQKNKLNSEAKKIYHQLV